LSSAALRPPLSPPDHTLGVEVPASAANLGPGFDAFAVALDIRLAAWVDDRGPRRVVCSGEGARELPTDERNLVWRAFSEFCRHAGVALPDCSIVTRNAIPLERGLGSSAAAAVAGVALGRAATGARVPDQDLIDIVARVEGHADNAAAAVMGGLVVCDGVRARRLEPSASLLPVVFVPTDRQSTTVSRAHLPESLSIADAAANAARAALVLAGLTGGIAWDPQVLFDVLHEPARFAAMPATADLVGRLRSAGVGACLSGSGPTVLAIVPAADLQFEASQTTTGRETAGDGVMRRVTTLAGEGWEVWTPGWDRAGAAVCPRPSS
jgi:homoserine kinase